MFKFEELRVYQEAIKFIDEVYLISQRWPKDEMFSLISQFRRAAVSIALNIAEGSSRTKKDFCHFLDMSRGSCYECVAILNIARNIEYINDKESSVLYELLDKIARMISALKISLR